MTSFQAWIPPAGAVVDPPVHPETVVDVIYSDRSEEDLRLASDLNWSADGDGPCVVAYAIVQEYKPKVAREWWLYGNSEGDRWQVSNYNPNGMWKHTIHVREVLPGREVVAWAVVDGSKMTLCRAESTADSVAVNHGGTVVRLSGVMP